jgi:hypothetical protein
MENLPNFENNEAVIDMKIEELALAEEMAPEDIFSDILTFAEIAKEDEDAQFYFEELAEKLGITFDEMMKYANGKLNEGTE